MKHRLKHILVYLFIILLQFMCFLLAACIIDFISSDRIMMMDVLKRAGTSSLGVAVFMTFAFLIAHFKGLHKRSYHEFINEIEEVIDRISKGDFGIQIDSKKYKNENYGDEHLTDLIDKINNMAKELGEMETMRQDFVSNVSHEIQSPLTSIRGFVSLLKDETLSKQERLHYIAVIESESQRLSKLSENLLRLSTLDSEFAEFNPRHYSLNRQLKDVILFMEPQWSAKEIEISLNVEKVEVFADEDLINQVWINLLNNSIKFTPDKGKISLSVSEDNMQILVKISDNGIGMKEENLPHVFERFYMADKARSRGVGGSGLGLSIVKRIVQIHHGSIDVESKFGEGTTFKIIIPKKS
ncbi:sensor histidine kinase [Clostridium aminobutyricum]|uniref:histidine kinase n=1 Tax=Clostridium aminobutyricum TaxID=33953 RepID=A0A939IJG2_CLOAM|nr:HAMP domain-containing sensor histidine kinase [Clostridium aminobutyricum]MBN7773549.1 two-component sensor histidine kinase [Clostridium aminobutyricum]